MMTCGYRQVMASVGVDFREVVVSRNGAVEKPGQGCPWSTGGHRQAVRTYKGSRS